MPAPSVLPALGSTNWFSWAQAVHGAVTTTAIARQLLASARDAAAIAPGLASGVTAALGTALPTNAGSIFYPMQAGVSLLGGTYEMNGGIAADGSNPTYTVRNRVGDPSNRVPSPVLETVWSNANVSYPLTIRLYSPNAATLGVRVWVDGRPVAADPITRVSAAGDTVYLTLTPATTGTRRIRIATQQAYYGGVLYDPRFNTAATDGARRPRIAVIGDSWADFGNQGVDELGLWTHYFGEAFGADLARMGIGGTGYAAPGFFGPFTNATRLARVAEFAPQLVIIQGSQNDPNTGVQAQVQQNATTVFNTLRSSLSTTPVIVIGPPRVNVAPTAAFITARDGVAAAAAAAPNVIAFIDNIGGYGQNVPAITSGTTYTAGSLVKDMNGVVYRVGATYTAPNGFPGPYTQPLSWITGTGTASAPANDGGNADVLLGSDGQHLTAAGHRDFAQRVFAAVCSALSTV